MGKKFLNLIKIIKNETKKPVMKILPGQLAFFFVLSLIPLISLVGLIGSIFSVSVDTFIEFIHTSFPPSTSSLIIPLIEGKGFDFGVLVFITSAFLLASNGTHSMIVTSNVLYGVSNENGIKQRIKAVMLTGMIVFLLGFIIIVPAFGNSILGATKNISFIKPVFDEILLIFNIFKFPLSFIFIYFNIKLIYTIAPDKNIRSKDSTIGALFTAVGWIVATELFSYYVTNFINYDIFYGSIANLITLLLWIYLLSYIFVVGLALNASTVQHKEELKFKKS